MIVLKFGGTSVGDAARVADACGIVELQAAPRAVIVSAAGGVTNLLLEAADAAAQQKYDEVSRIVNAIREKHFGVAAGIGDDRERTAALAELDQLHAALDAALADVAAARQLSKRNSDRVVSTGEKAMSVMFAATLRSRGTPAAHVFADRVISTDDRFGSARPDKARTRAATDAVVRPLLEQNLTVVMTGFIGFAPDGSTTTLGRGGSDYSATLLGAALEASEVQIWTDVPGVLSADPRQVPAARVVSSISFDEAQELAHFGAKVLHPRTIRPAVALGIPVRILSTFAPNEPGTIVTRESSGHSVKAVTAMKGLMLVTIDVPELEDLAAAASSVFGQLAIDRVEIVHVSQASSRRRMTYLVDGAAGGGCAKVTCRIEDALLDSDAEVGCTEDVAVVAAVGEGASAHPAALAKMLGLLDRAGVPVLAASQQSSNVALIAAVPGKFAARAVETLHEAFIGNQAASSKARRPRRSRLIGESLRVG
jgi:bifunctional aspartokinase / homoserine dehydrogenase 1